MSFSPLTAKWMAAYEQEYGGKPSEEAVRIMEHISKVGTMLRNQGRKDAQERRKPLDAAVMQALVRWVFHWDADEDPELVEPAADLWMAGYMAGYQEGGEDRGH